MHSPRVQLLPIALSAALIGCGEMEGDAGNSENAATASENGLRTINGIRTVNGLPTVNGLRTVNGLATNDGLASGSGLMTTADGRTQISYLVRCALPAGTSITKQDQYGTSYTFQGLVGLAPEWQNGACDQTCQEYMSACLLAHVNTAGIHVPLWIVAYSQAVGWGQDPNYPNQEAAFMGNIFVLGAHGSDQTIAPAYYCMGAKYNVSPVQGRLGSTQTSPPYVDVFGAATTGCAGRCADADYPHQGDGWKACNGWNQVVTVWRQMSGTTDSNPTGPTGHGYRWK